MLDTGREVFRITGRMQAHLGKLVLARGVVGELAVEPAELIDDRLGNPEPHLLGAGYPWCQLDRDGQ